MYIRMYVCLFVCMHACIYACVFHMRLQTTHRGYPRMEQRNAQ